MRFGADHLVVFATLAEAGTVTAAARELGMSQPAVSSRMRSLEALVGRRLYVPGPRAITLTPTGVAMLPHARAVARAVQRASRAARVALESEQPVVIALSEAAVPLAIPHIARLALGPPRRRFRVVPTNAANAAALVAAHEADLAVVVAPPDQTDDGLQRRQVLVDEIVLLRAGAAPERAPLAAVGELTVVWQSPGSSVRAVVERALEAAGVAPRVELEIGTSFGLLAAVEAGVGAAFLPRSFLARERRVPVAVTRLDSTGLRARFEVVVESLDDLPPAPASLVASLLEAAGAG